MRCLACICVTLIITLGCSKPADQEAPAAVEVTAVSFNAAGAPTVEFTAPDMMCPDGCGEKVKEILSGQPGAKEVLVDFEARKAIVAIEGDGKFDASAAVAALMDHGFKNSSVKENAAATDPIAKPHAEGAVQ